MKKVDKEKVLLAVAIVLWSLIGSYYIQPLVHNNQHAINVIVTVFTVLAGFLIAIITLIGDPKSLPSGSWQKAELAYKRTHNRLVRHKLLFQLYLLTLALIFISFVLKDQLARYQYIIEYIYIFMTLTAFILSLKLPSSLLDIQQERIEHEIDERREKEGIKKL
ncbi:hypothetical protein CXF86_19100 [Shewanella sp. GutCb]|uniref:hypothetical protein n=1 Tax=Shewanella sp. GutCb TaxID=2058315 RepID=UPI000C7C2052|nr:hypothetical protein [Shewanella sp. GutCb]PKG73159.1 hypothetical protein CXF86_19100 [Shewanella sp. GutCb]